VAEPAATPVTTPFELTVAAAELLVDHATVWPAIPFPFWSFTVACKFTVAPATTDAEAGDIATLVTTGRTVDVAVDAAATFEAGPNTAPLFRVPRNGIT